MKVKFPQKNSPAQNSAFLRNLGLWAAILSFLAIAAMQSSCSKEKFNTDSGFKLEFSVDTVWFDTVFTTIGSVTKRLKIYNRSNAIVQVSRIRLEGGPSSPFRLNVDGLPGILFSEVLIGPRDSIYLFAEVTVDPTNELMPFLVEDRVIFETNGNIQDVALIAYGRNARFYKPTVFPPNFPAYSLIECNAIWDNTLPIVIIGYAALDSACTLQIMPGTQIYMYNNAGLWIFKDACIKAEGAPGDSIVFQGFRKEPFYQTLAGQWDRIWINQGSQDNVVRHVLIKNGFIGLQVENVEAFGPGQQPGKLSLYDTRIQNMSGLGIFAKDYEIDAGNLFIGDCKEYAIAIIRGGKYRFRHTTVANYWSGGIRQNAAVYLSNQSNVQSEGPKALNPCFFGNSILYGNLNSGREIEFNFDLAAPFLPRFERSLIRSQDLGVNPSGDIFVNCLFNQDPAFESVSERRFKLKANSPAIGLGSQTITESAPALPFDLLGKPRDTQPDAGAFEFHP